MKTASLLAVLTLLALPSVGLAEPAPTAVVAIEHGKVDAAFAQGQSLVDNDSYSISAGRRVMPGTAELHENITDIFHVQSGEATFVTGGKIVEPKTTGPGEIRGKAIEGGTPHHLVKGDMIIIPAGTAHQYTEVNDTFLYLVIKVKK